MALRSLPYSLRFVDEKIAYQDQSNYDAIIFLAFGVTQEDINGVWTQYRPVLLKHVEVDQDYGKNPFVIALDESFKIRRLVFSTFRPSTDFFDAREFFEVASRGVIRAIQAGSKNPLIVVSKTRFGYTYADIVSMLGAMEAIYTPLEVRNGPSFKAQSLTFTNFSTKTPQLFLDVAQAIENGRAVARDIGGSDPETMAAPNVANYVEKLFEDTLINVKIISDPNVIDKEFPLLSAVNRAARGIDRHTARVIFLEYVPKGKIDTTLVLVGKGVTYDTGGADVKAGGHMAGMHRDKCGAAAVAGFFKTLSSLKPEGIKVVGAMAMVRNSIGSDSYVADEIITARSGERIRIGNTDAEGRMAMADVLCYLKEQTLKDVNPLYFTVATLTGHACLAVGNGYSIIVDNVAARATKVGQKVQEGGDLVGDLFEISTMRREDVEFHKGKSEYETLLQCNNLPSSQTPRGHQSPSAFLWMASGLSKHTISGKNPLKYSHIDIAASSGDFPGIPTGAPIGALTAAFLFSRVLEEEE